jgi:ABC-2 type transport system permease protein
MGKMEGDTTQAADFKKIFQGIGIREEQLGKANKKEHVINSVQHNVPAWAIFGMFFIVIPIAGHMIRERDERSTMRIELIPRAYRFVAMGKILFYTLICTLQFICMFCIGIWLMPVLGLPALSLGAHPFSILLAGICIAYTATAYGYFVGAMFKTSNQAMPFGAISVVILSAIGGVWVPADILSPMMQKLSFISPLRWGLDAINTIMLRNGSITDVLLHMTVLLALGTLLWLISIYKNARRYSNQ